MFPRIKAVWRRLRASRLREAQLMDRQLAYRHHEVGRFSYGSPALHFANSGAKLHVGQFCSIANNVKIFLGGEHRTDWVTTYPFAQRLAAAVAITGHPATKGDVVIGNDVWIGHGATILSGVQIGDGAVVGAHAVVSRHVAPYTIVAGNPATVVRLRFTPTQVQALLAVAWWNWPLPRIEAALPLLLSGDIDGFIQASQDASHPP